jgi:spore maturation protein CgeB
MRILFAAPVTFDRITFFISQYVVGLARAARELGHEVRIIQTTENADNPYVWKIIRSEFLTMRKYFKSVADVPHDALLAKQILEEIRDFQPHLLFIHLIDTSYIHLLMKKIKKEGIKVVAWLGVHPSIASKGIRNVLKSVDYTLIYDSSYIDYFVDNLHINNTYVIPLGCDIPYYDTVNPDDSFKEANGVDVCFVGMLDQDREKYLKALYDFKLGIWSWNIDGFDTSLKTFHRGVVYGDNLIKVFKSSKIVLNVHKHFEISGGNFRLFEIPSCNVFQIVDAKRDIGKYFHVGDEIVTFKNEFDLREKVKYYLEHHEERQKIANAGYTRAKKEHTLKDRMKIILNLFK